MKSSAGSSCRDVRASKSKGHQNQFWRNIKLNFYIKKRKRKCLFQKLWKLLLGMSINKRKNSVEKMFSALLRSQLFNVIYIFLFYLGEKTFIEKLKVKVNLLRLDDYVDVIEKLDMNKEKMEWIGKKTMHF